MAEKARPVRMKFFDDGEWHASTLGHFIELLVDSRDEAVLFRVTRDFDEDADGRYKRAFEIVTLPQGQVKETIAEKMPIGVHVVLAALIGRGVVK